MNLIKLIASMNFQTVFETESNNAESMHFFLMGGTVIFCGGVAALAFQASQHQWPRKKTVLLLVLLVCIAGCGISYPVLNYLELKELSNHGALPIVEGVVSNFRSAKDGQKFDSFCVQAQCFTIMEFGSNDGYQVLAAKGGSIREGQYLRLTYYKGVIFKIEKRD